MAEIKTGTKTEPRFVKIFKEINMKKELILEKKDIKAIMNALEFYKDSQPFKPEYKVYLKYLRSCVLQLEDW